MDGYELYELLKAGKPVNITVKGTLYQAQFIGQSYGSDNYLELKAPDGTKRRWGWGWNSEVCWRCLDDLERGWEQQTHAYKSFNDDHNEKENQYL